MNIIFVRHGQTDWNINGRLQGSSDMELNECGHRQAEEIANRLLNTHIDILYSSPLKRAIDTAQYINKCRNLELFIDDRLIERSFGDYEGTSDNNLDMKKYWDYYLNLSNHNIEPIQNLFNRCYDLLLDICKKYEYDDNTILLVSHNGINLAISSIILGYRQNIFEYNLKNCDYRVFNNITQKELEESYGKFKI